MSEWVKPRPDTAIVSWLDEVDEDRVFLSAVSLAEIRFGVERLAPRRRRSRLDEWLREEFPKRFEGRVVPVNEEVADARGRLLARARQAGRGLGAMDALSAATCLACDLVLATRNLGDFEGLGIELFAPRRLSIATLSAMLVFRPGRRTRRVASQAVDKHFREELPGANSGCGEQKGQQTDCPRTEAAKDAANPACIRSGHFDIHHGCISTG